MKTLEKNENNSPPIIGGLFALNRGFFPKKTDLAEFFPEFIVRAGQKVPA